MNPKTKEECIKVYQMLRMKEIPQTLAILKTIAGARSTFDLSDNEVTELNEILWGLQ